MKNSEAYQLLAEAESSMELFLESYDKALANLKKDIIALEDARTSVLNELEFLGSRKSKLILERLQGRLEEED